MAQFYDDLKVLEGALYQAPALAAFLEKHPLHEVLNTIAKATDKEKRLRLDDLFRRLMQTDYVKQIILLYRAADPAQRKTFANFVKSANSQLFFSALEQHGEFVLNLLSEDKQAVELLFGLMAHQHGIKLLRMWEKLYKKHPESEVLLSEAVLAELQKGLKNEDSVVQMRFMELIVKIATLNENIFEFVKKSGLLHQAVELYNTPDMLLKLNVVEVMEQFGESPWTIKFLKDDDKVWQLIQKEAFDQDTEFYVRKYLLQLLTKMHSMGCFKFTPEIAKNIVVFVRSCITSKSFEEVSSALTIIGNLNRTHEGVKLVIGDGEIIRHYVAIAHTTKDELKGKFLASLSDLAIKGTKPDNIVLNILSCVGDNSLAKVENLKEGSANQEGLRACAKWLMSWMILPFHELQMEGIFLIRELLDYKKMTVELFQDKNIISFLKQKGKDEFIIAKNTLIKEIMRRGETEWQGSELAEFCKVLRKELERKDTEEAMYEVVSKE